MQRFKLGRKRVENDIALAQLEAAERQPAKGTTLKKVTRQSVIDGHYHTVKHTHLKNARARNLMGWFYEGIQEGIASSKEPVATAQRLTKDIAPSTDAQFHNYAFMGLARRVYDAKTIEAMFAPQIVGDAVTRLQTAHDFSYLFVLARRMIPEAFLNKPKDYIRHSHPMSAFSADFMSAFGVDFSRAFWQSIKPEMAKEYAAGLVQKARHDDLIELTITSAEPFASKIGEATPPQLIADIILNLVQAIEEKPGLSARWEKLQAWLVSHRETIISHGTDKAGEKTELFTKAFEKLAELPTFNLEMLCKRASIPLAIITDNSRPAPGSEPNFKGNIL